MDQAKVAALILCLLLAGCATSSPPSGLPCSVGPILLDEDDRLTDGTARQIVGLNNTGADPRVCGWKAPGS